MVTFKWRDVKKKSFEVIKGLFAHKNVIEYPNFNECFDIHTNARDYELGAVIIQAGKSTPSYSHKHVVSQ